MIQQILNCLPRINDCRSVVLCNFRCYISITFSIIIALLTKAVTPLQQVYNRHRR